MSDDIVGRKSSGACAEECYCGGLGRSVPPKEHSSAQAALDFLLPKLFTKGNMLYGNSDFGQEPGGVYFTLR